jgi:BirA family biotin operon repressor/biotin-[acetyl-CoA-carboxylase] ligase
MIKNTHPEFEVLVTEGLAPATPELLEYLGLLGVEYNSTNAGIHLPDVMELLDADLILSSIRQGLSPSLGDDLEIEIHRRTGSTNDEVMEGLTNKNVYQKLCVAEMQTAGKGRRGRNWISPFGRNIYLSYGRFLNGSLSSLGGLSLVAGMQVVDVLRDFGAENVGLKWPNDVLLAGGKLAGILVELKPAEKRGTGVVIGIGINLSLGDKDASAIEQHWSVLPKELSISRNRLVGSLSARLVKAIDQFEREGFAAFTNQWNEYNLFSGDKVLVSRGQERFEGVDRGIDADGQLMLETESGIEIHNAGEVSLRKIESS